MLIKVRFKKGRIDLGPSDLLEEITIMSESDDYVQDDVWVIPTHVSVRSTLRGHYSAAIRRRR